MRASLLLAKTLLVTVTADRVDERRAFLCTNHLDRALESRTYLRGIGDRTLGVPAERTREHREVGRRVVDLLTDARVLLRRAAMLRDPELMLPVVVVGAVVVHDDQQRDAVVRGGPERARVVQEITVGLNVDDEAVRAAIRQANAE